MYNNNNTHQTQHHTTLATILSPSALPNNDSFIDITSPKREEHGTEPVNLKTQRNVNNNSPLQQTSHEKKKSVRIDEAPPEIYNRSPSQHSLISSIQYSGMSPMNTNNTIQLPPTHSTINNSPNNHNNNNNNNNHTGRAHKYTHQTQHILTPFQYIMIVCAKMYSFVFILGHLVLHSLILTLLIYTVTKSPSIGDTSGADGEGSYSRVIDGFTIFLFITTIMQLLTVITGVVSSQGSELSLQVYAVTCGFGTIAHSVSTGLWAFLFPQIMKNLHSTHTGSTIVSVKTTTLVSLYDILREFYTILIIINVLDLVGLFISLAFTYIRIKHVYDALPNQKITFKTIIASIKTNNNKKMSRTCTDTVVNPNQPQDSPFQLGTPSNHNNDIVTGGAFAPTNNGNVEMIGIPTTIENN